MAQEPVASVKGHDFVLGEEEMVSADARAGHHQPVRT